MHKLLWVVTLLPFVGAFILAIFGASMPKKVVGTLACSFIGAAWVVAMVVMRVFLGRGLVSAEAPLYSWMQVNGLRVGMTLHLDALSLVMMVVVTFVAFLIHLYAAQSMYDEDGYSRFFAYMNLFVGSMLVLVLASNLLTLYLGWEGVGLCSYLLIGFWYRDIKNVHAANKAFIVTRIGDTALAIGLFLLFKHFGTLDIQSILLQAPAILPVGGAVVTAIAFLLIGGAIGKSAQIPLQTWLPDAMAGPSPVSALIHAATMVTAGVYLIARMHTIIAMSQAAQFAVAVIGTVTLVYAGFSALTQTDIKRVLAYSTISQIGYMFLALGVGAWTAAIFHLVTHAFFKALLFLSAGIVIDALSEEHSLFKMGGLKNRLPVAFWTFLIGAASLSALPYVTAGYYSKHAIISASWSSQLGSIWFLLGGIVGTLLTSAYAFRVVFLAFFGEPKTEVAKQPRSLEKLAVVVLAFFALTAGFVKYPFGRLMSSVLPPEMLSSAHSGMAAELAILVTSIAVTFIGIYLAYAYFRNPQWSEAFGRSAVGRAVHAFLLSGWGMNKLYDRVFVRTFEAVAYRNSADFVDNFFAGLANMARYANLGLSKTQTGRVRNYAAGLLIGAIVLAAIVLLR